MANKVLYLTPVRGKFAQVTIEGKEIQIWREFEGNPKGKVGTPVDYATAVKVLCLQPAIASIVPQIKDGKYVSQLEEKDAELVAAAQTTGQSLVSNTFNQLAKEEKAGVRASSVETEALQKQIEAQDAQIKSQNELLTKALAEIEALKATKETGKTPSNVGTPKAVVK